jgi:hypothetical protein
MNEEITITIEVKGTSNKRVFEVGTLLCVGRIETRRAMLAKAKADIEEGIAKMFPTKGEEE